MTTTASDGSLRMDNHDVNRKVEALESDCQDPRDLGVTTEKEFRSINANLDEMQETNESILDAIASLRVELANWMADGKKPQGTVRRGVDPLVEIKVNSPETNSRYYDSTLDRNACDGLDRVECHVFDRSTPFRDWLYRCEKYFEHYRISEQSKVRKAYYKLDGEAMEWHWDFMCDKRDRVVSWDEYVQNMALRFDRTRVRDPMVQLHKLQQVGSVEEYHKEFEELRYQARWPESRALNRFLGGLKEKLQGLVRLNEPTTVAEACDYVITYEEALKPIPPPSPFLRKILDAECSRVESEELGVKEVNEKCKEYQEREAKRKNEEEELNVVLQTVEDSMELQTETRKDAEQVYNVQNVDLQADVEEELSSLEAAQTIHVLDG